MTVEVLLDTSYLISLVDAKRPNHQAATKYYRQMLDESLPMYFLPSSLQSLASSNSSPTSRYKYSATCHSTFHMGNEQPSYGMR